MWLQDVGVGPTEKVDLKMRGLVTDRSTQCHLDPIVEMSRRYKCAEPLYSQCRLGRIGNRAALEY